jgi:hypothetical protein
MAKAPATSPKAAAIDPGDLIMRQSRSARS